MSLLSGLSSDIKQYLTITGNYWVFTLTDGALRMLVVLHFHQLGYSPLQIALLFLFYEIFGVITNLVGGWLGAVIGLNRTMQLGLGLQIIALSMLLVPNHWLTVGWVMCAQAVSGIAKDLNKMSAKSSIKLLVPSGAESTLYRWVALLTGSKNTLKGAGFFLGGTLLSLYGFQGAVLFMLGLLIVACLISLMTLSKKLGLSNSKPTFKQLFAKRSAINYLSAARLFLFASRDIWFVVALPVYLSTTLSWDFWQVGSLLASWLISYGGIQALTPRLTGLGLPSTPDGISAFYWALTLAVTPALMAAALYFNLHTSYAVFIGLALFGLFFSVNSSIHSYLIVSYADKTQVAMDVGFYYMANAGGRLLGTVLSGYLYQCYGLASCLALSSIFILFAAILSTALPTLSSNKPSVLLTD
ncbi:MAG: organoarsenical effux MFS transporter ArsJ [Cycloclasticus sp.]|nr:organoarsenical effux MFS transporter ArsJ [Cycloclasticus sp.]MBQ0790243.1 organoarsenical effux MFS transporter ArsJ [Cycloclasticus sp.]